MSMPTPLRYLHGIVGAINIATIMSACLALIMIALTVLIVNHMIVIRYMGDSVVWHMELAIYLTIGAIFLGSPYAAKTKGHVAVDLLENAVPKRIVVPVQIGVHAIVFVVCSYLANAGAGYAWHAFQSDLTSTSLWAPYLWPVYATLPIGLGLTALQSVAEIVELTTGFRRGCNG